MSAGAFEIGRYESSDTGAIHAIRVQPETKALMLGGSTNAYPAGAIAQKPSAQVSKGRRSIGINARTVSIRLTAPLAGYKVGSVIRLPWFVPSTFGPIGRGVVGTYLGVPCEVAGTTGEKTS